MIGDINIGVVVGAPDAAAATAVAAKAAAAAAALPSGPTVCNAPERIIG